MKTLSKTLFVTFFLIGSSASCFAATIIQDVSTEQAREWGVEFKSRPNGDAGVQVRLELKTQGKWEKYSRIEFRITSGEERLAPALASAPLEVGHPSPDSIATSFSVQESALKECEIWIYVNDIPKGGSAYRFKVKDFVELK